MLLLLAAVIVKATLEEDITLTSLPLLSSLINFISGFYLFIFSFCLSSPIRLQLGKSLSS